MRRALHELRVVGVETSREFHLRVMEDDEYRRGDVSIQWLEQRLREAHRQRSAAIGSCDSPPSPRRCSRTVIAGHRRFTIHDSRFTIHGTVGVDAGRRDALR